MSRTRDDGAEAPSNRGDPTRLDAPLGRSPEGSDPLDLRELDLRGGRFAGADLRDADLQQACLAEADLTGADLSRVRLRSADLSLACLVGADLRGADLAQADLSGADLRDCRLDGADLGASELGWARVEGARGLPPGRLPAGLLAGRVPGKGLPDHPEEPAAGVAAWQRGRQAHAAGDIGLAEQLYRTSLAWVPESAAARYGLACAALERRDPEAACRWLRECLVAEREADRARLDLALLLLAAADPEQAAAVLAPLAGRISPIGQGAAAALAGLAAGDPEAATEALAGLVPDSPALRWLRAGPRRLRPQEAVDPIARLADPAWVEAEREDLTDLLRDEKPETWLLHAAIARAIAIGAMDLAARAEQRLQRLAPEQRLWGLELRQLDVTAEAFAALVRTRRRAPGRILSLGWVALGVHGPTARIACEGGVFFAKRYDGQTRPAASVAFTHRILRSLAELGFEVPVALGDGQGDDVLVFGSDLLALYPDLGGRHIADSDLDPETAAAIAHHLAFMHLESAGLAAGPGRPPGGVRIGSRLLRQARPGPAWEAQVCRDRGAALFLERHPWRRRLLSLLEATGRRLSPLLARCAPALVHGDFGPGNVLVGPRGLQVLDWDLCDVDLAVWDLARTIDRAAVSWPLAWGRPVEIRTGVAAAMVRGYSEVRRLHSHELAALPLLVAGSRVDMDAALVHLAAPVDEEVAELVIEGMRARLSRAAAGMPELADVVADAAGAG
jgi:Ser/Thr protein kinase RdoA (MazF antagonist)